MRSSFNALLLILLSSLMFFLVSCGGSSGGGGNDLGGNNGGEDEPEDPVDINTEFGYLIDAAVEGLRYEAGEVFGFTDSSGRFRFIPHEPVAFSYAGMSLGTVTLNEADSVVTPAELRGVSRDEAPSDVTTVNLLRLLQTLDSDSDPSNGIRLLEAQMLGDFGLEQFLSAVELDDVNFDAQLQSALNEFEGETGTSLTLVSREDALAHFDISLELLAVPETFIEYSGADQWSWDIHTNSFGEWAARVRFDADGSGLMEEFSDCAEGSGDADSWVANYARASAICNQRHAEEITWSLNGNVLEISTDSFTDTCKILSGTVHRAKGSCLTYRGEGRYATETQYFVRTEVNGFYPKLISERFYEFNRQGVHNRGDYSLLTYREDGTADYRIPRAGTDETGSFDWSIANDRQAIVYSATDNPDEQTNFVRYLAGAYDVDVDASRRIMIPNYAPVRMSSGWAYRYSASDGRLLTSSTQDPDSVWRCQNSTTGELCYLVGGTDYACQAIHNFPTRRGDSVYWMHCGVLVGDAPSSFQIWRLQGGS
ncbi:MULTISPECIES: hypothetical protein [unclassified Marinimicrobium]|uniref:hypothetical protein n=1 Tax=Marinimicrobium TaxID=359337 RepID=UPI000C63B49F|nr:MULTISPECIES: hypothetical protein [unclassified Marinimicrobium]MAN53089.1 hypothetical protein [Marinimicrobium sp.]|tara:strand:- start:3754 stop:5370 length:1617 start_codon:yes stop_codon:yes gene_type:complete